MVSTLLRLAVLLVGLTGAASAQVASPAQMAAPAQTAPSAQDAAQPAPSHLAAARELMQTTGVLSPVDELLPAFLEQLRKQNVTRPDLTKDLEEVLNGLKPELLLQKQQITNVVAKTYAKWLTEPELKEITAFFKTPVGAKFNKVQVDLVDDVVVNVKSWTADASEYIMVRTRAEMLKRGHQLQ